MATASLQLTGSVANLPTGSKAITVPTLQVSNAVGTITDLSLISGDNTISVPTGATRAVILIPDTNTSLIRLKDNVGDTGIAIALTGWLVLSLDSTQTVFILNAAGPIAGLEISFI